MAAASLIVRISADLNDFSRNLKKMTRDVDSAAKKVSDVGKAMSLAITVPVGLATAAFLKMGMEQAATSAKLDREFGASAERVNATLERITKIIPVTGGELQDAANKASQFGRGIGMSRQQANALGPELVKMAAVLKQATPGAAFEDASQAIDKALQGSTRGLKEFGVTIGEAEIKQEGYRLGLLKIGQELTPLGTAMATYSLLTKRLATVQGEAAATQKDVATQWQFLKAQASELGESIGLRLLPAFGSVVAVGRGVVQFMSELPEWMKSAAIYTALFAAAAGPLLIALVGMASAIVKLKAALDILKGVELFEKLGEMVTGWKAAAVALAVVAVAVIGIAVAWSYFKKKGEEAAGAADDILKKFTSAMDVMKAGGSSAPTSMSTTSPDKELQKRAQALASAFESGVHFGDDLKSTVAQINALNGEALALYDRQADKLGEMAQAARQVAEQTQRIIALQRVSRVQGTLGVTGTQLGAAVGAASRQLTSPGELRLAALNDLIAQETDLRRREIAIDMPNVFNAVRAAAVSLKEDFRAAQNVFALSVERFKQSWRNAGGSAMAGLKDAVSQIVADFTPAGLAARAIGAVLQGLQPVIDALFAPLTALGQIVGLIVIPIFRALFPSIKALGIVVALVGEVIYTVASGIARLVGNLIVAIGKFIAKIPFLGGIGKDIQNAGNGMLDLAKSFSNTAKDLDKARRDLQDMSFDEAMNGVASAANKAAASLLNVPDGFRIALARFNATRPIGGDTSSFGAAAMGATADSVVVLNLDGQEIARGVVRTLKRRSQAQFGTTLRWAEVSV